MNDKGKCLLLALDGFSKNIFDSIKQTGNFIFVDNLFAKGRVYNCKTNLCARGWPTILTGENAGRYKGYYYVVDCDNYDFKENFNLNNYFRFSLFNKLSSQGLSMVVIGVPTTYPPHKINGAFVSAGAAGAFPDDLREMVYPEELADSYSEYLRSYIPDVRVQFFDNSIGYLRELIKATKRKTKFAIKLINDYSPDISIIGFAGCDRIGHTFWPYIERNGYEDLLDKAVLGLIREYFSVLDRSIEAIIKRFHYDKIIMVSDHGLVGRNATLFVNNLLVEGGFAYPSSSFLKRLKEKVRDVVINRFSPNVRAKLKTLTQKNASVSKKVALNAPPLDWHKSVAFGAYVHGIYINSRKRYKDGIVSETDYEGLRKEIMAFLRSYNHPGYGQIFEHVGKREEFFSGKYMEDAPDIVFDLQDGIEIRGEMQSSETIEPFKQVIYSLKDQPVIHNGIHSKWPLLYTNYRQCMEKRQELTLSDVVTIINS